MSMVGRSVSQSAQARKPGTIWPSSSSLAKCLYRSGPAGKVVDCRARPADGHGRAGSVARTDSEPGARVRWPFPRLHL